MLMMMEQSETVFGPEVSQSAICSFVCLSELVLEVLEG